MQTFNAILSAINGILWHEAVLYVVLGVGALLVVWTKFGPLVALTHGVAIIRGKSSTTRMTQAQSTTSKLFQQPFQERSASATSAGSPWRSRWVAPEPCSGCGS